jgi:hypothetical protein
LPSEQATNVTLRLPRLAGLATGAVLLAGVTGCALGGGDDDDKKPAAEKAAKVQTVTFQEPEDRGPDPFTEPADVEGSRTVRVSSGARAGDSGGSQPFGGSGSNRVCDRDKLLRFLKANPERMRAWAEALGVPPRLKAVRRYIAKLHPVTLTRDTRITNHAFRDGRAVPFQAILKAGTAVLVDRHGTPVVRCFCGNPLKPAVFIKSAKCVGCPPNYTPPEQCKFGQGDDYDEIFYRRSFYSNGDYDEVFIRRSRRSRYGDCYAAYPDPPAVTFINVFRRPEPPRRQAPPAEPAPPQQPGEPPGATPAEEPSGLQCNPARSQAEAERCCRLRGGCQEEPAPEPPSEPAPEPTLEPTPEPTTAPTPEPVTDICNDGLDNEGVSGLVDGADPNCGGG